MQLVAYVYIYKYREQEQHASKVYSRYSTNQQLDLRERSLWLVDASTNFTLELSI
jgi:hypothetical protein